MARNKTPNTIKKAFLLDREIVRQFDIFCINNNKVGEKGKLISAWIEYMLAKHETDLKMQKKKLRNK